MDQERINKASHFYLAEVSTISCSSKIQIGFTFLVPAHPGSPGQRAVKRVYVCVCVCEVSASSSLQCSDNARRLDEQSACKHYTNLTLDKHKRIQPIVRGEAAYFRSGVRPKRPKPEAQKADSAGEVLGEREARPSPPRGFGSTVSSPSGVQSRALATKTVSCILEAPDGLSSNLWHVSWPLKPAYVDNHKSMCAKGSLSEQTKRQLATPHSPEDGCEKVTKSVGLSLCYKQHADIDSIYT